MNILILSVGTRNKIVEYFKRELDGKGKVIVTDMSKLAPALYEADDFYIVSNIHEENYLDEIIDICKKESISAVFSLIDPELAILAKNQRMFNEIGVKVIGSSFELCNRALNKIEMYKWLNDNNYKSAKSYNNKEEFYRDVDNGTINYPVFIKPIEGSASISINIVDNKEQMEVMYNDKLMIQEFLHGQEIGADCYIDMLSGEIISIFTKRKIKMRAGETDKAVSFKDDKLFKLIDRFISESGWKGEIDIDIFEIDGNYYISEVNPRFGGGYPHAYECGANHIKMICNNIENKANQCEIGNYKSDIFMMKYCDLKTL